MSDSHPSHITVIDPWLDRYRAFRSERSDSRLDDFKREFARLGEGLKPLRALAAERAKAETPAFNVFRILRLQRKEVITHSPFLANLLNPAGTHAQGELFLGLFFERLAQRHARLPTSQAGGRWYVRQEQATDSGNLDIHLWSHPLRCQIVIENKIDAVDQEDQLPRYWDHMQSQRAQFDFQHLVYLTPEPRLPVTTARLLPPYINLTYHHDICAILRSALAIIRSPRLQYSLEQYLEITSNI